MPRKPVPRISMIAGDFLLITFVVANDIFLRQVIEFTKVSTKLRSFFVDCIEVGCIGQVIFTDLKSNMAIIGLSTRMPASMIPWQGLIGSDGTIFKFSDKGMDTNLS